MRKEPFERGFLHVFQMTGKQFLDDAGALRAVAPLDTLFLRRLKGKEVAVFASEHFAGVSRLWAKGAQMTDAGVSALTSSPHVGRVRRLGLGRSVLGDAEEANKLTDASAVALAETDNLPALTHLELDGYKKITLAGIRAIVESAKRAGLKGLDVSGGGAGPGVAALFGGPAFRLTSLEELRMSDHKLGRVGAETLAAAPELRHLRLLSLTRNKIDDRGAAALAASPHLSALVDLDLWTNNLTDEGVLAILASPGMRGVRKLELGGNTKITDSSARAILADGRPWEKVGLDGTRVSIALLREIAARCA